MVSYIWINNSSGNTTLRDTSGKFKKGIIPWNKGKKGVMPTVWNKGSKGICKTNSGSFKKGNKPPHTGKTKKDFPKLGNAGLKKANSTSFKSGENHSNFRNWASRKEYTEIWSPELRNEIRKRDGYRCQECFRHKSELNSNLHVHHIDFNKKNNTLKNLISLCHSCHMKTQYKPQSWVSYYKNVQEVRGL